MPGGVGQAVSERRHVQRRDERDQRAKLLVHLSRGLLGQHVRDRRAQRLRRPALPQRRHLFPRHPRQLHVRLRHGLQGCVTPFLGRRTHACLLSLGEVMDRRQARLAREKTLRVVAVAFVCKQL